MAALTSRAKRLLDLKVACTSDATGNEQCEADEMTEQLQNTNIGSSPETPASRSKGKQCSGSCVDPDQCDIDSNCLCASDKGIPLSSSWGTYTCRFVTDIAALAGSAASTSNDCRGRCLLDANGTFEVTNTVDAPFQNPISSEFTCPCNCTYISRACCLSQTKIVWEDPSEKINTVLQAPNATVCCDATTGKWAALQENQVASSTNPICSSGETANNLGVVAS